MCRVLFVVWLVCGSANADTLIQDGDYEAELTVTDDGLLMTGGQVDRMILWGDGPYDLEGGQVGPVELESGDLNVSGGTVSQIARSERRSGGNATTVRFEGHYFRVYDAGLLAYNTYRVEGWLTDGSFVSLNLINAMELSTRFLPVEFDIVTSTPPQGDFSQDWSVDLTDLNYVRNNFGDLTTLDDLNAVRNNFGVGQFTLNVNDPHVTEYTQTTLVPEPCTLVLFLILTICLKGMTPWLTN